MMSEELKFPHISTGDMLRDALKNQTELGEKAKGFMNTGALVPDELVDAIVAERLIREDCRRGFILDGYPRTIPQAEFLRSIFEKDQTEVLTIGVEVGDEVLVKRLSSRWTCPKCGKIFNANLNRGRVGGACEECGAALIQRKDDKAEVVAERLQVYHRTTEPLIQYYRDRGSYVEIDGEGSVDEIFGSVMGVIKNYE